MADHGRVDEQGRAFKGSQLQVQIYVNKRTRDLSDAVSGFLGLDDWDLEWVPPIESDRYREHQDRAFLAAVRQEVLGSSLAGFWPKGGPVWDALAIVRRNDEQGVLLVEAKSYTDDMSHIDMWSWKER